MDSDPNSLSKSPAPGRRIFKLGVEYSYSSKTWLKDLLEPNLYPIIKELNGNV
jgi:hypothetical protein